MVRANLAGAAMVVNDGYWDRLAAAVRPEFQVDTYLPERADGVLGVGLCRVAACDALASGRGWCTTHHRELRDSALSDEAFAATAAPGPARRRHGALRCRATPCPNGAGSPHPNACLTCPDFLTDVTFLDGHREQHGRTRKLIATAEASGQFRLVEMDRKVEANLGAIIATLETLEAPDAR